MNSSLIPFNMDFKIGDDLREFPDDPEQMKKGIKFLQDKMDEDDLSDIQVANLASQIGVYQRIVGDLDSSESMLIQALSTFEELGKKVQALHAEMRLAVTFQWKGNFTKSEELFRNSLKKISKSQDPKIHKYEDFALQHLGKQKFEQEQIQEALDLFTKALELRLIKGEMALIESTEHAIEVTRKKL